MTVARIDTIYSDILTDNYFWIRDKSNSEVIAMRALTAATNQG